MCENLKVFLEVEDNLRGMEEVVECLKYEPEGSQENRMAKSAQITIAQAKEVLSMISFVSK